MRRRLLSHLTYANVMVTILAFIVLGGGSAVALSGSNTVQSDDLGPGSQVTAPDVAANAVNGSDVVDNSLTGADILESSLTGNVRKLVYNASAADPAPITKIATVGPYTLKGQCLNDGGDPVRVRLYANGPAGSADYMYDETENDSTSIGTTSNGVLIPANTNFQIVATFGVVLPHTYRRIAGTAMLRSGSVLVQVDFDAVADGRSTGSCFIYGTATRAT